MPPPTETPSPAPSLNSPEFNLRRQLLGVVLRETLRKGGIPAEWIAGEVLPLVLPNGAVQVEVHLSVTIDEPRVYFYLSSLQASFERRLQAMAPDAKDWVAKLSWHLSPDPSWEVAMPAPDYWEQVAADRELTMKKDGGKPWTADELKIHFSDTNPSEFAADFGDTQPPERQMEDVRPSKPR